MYAKWTFWPRKYFPISQNKSHWDHAQMLNTKVARPGLELSSLYTHWQRKVGLEELFKALPPTSDSVGSRMKVSKFCERHKAHKIE